MSEDNKDFIDRELDRTEAAKREVSIGSESSKPIVKPLWEGWAPPTSPSAALALGENYARMEGLWCQADLFMLRQEAELGEDVDLVNVDKLRKKVANQGLTCGDIKACSVGILIMSVLDGPAVARYFNPRAFAPRTPSGRISTKYQPGVEDELVDHTVGQPSLVFLAAGMARAVAETPGSVSVDIAHEPNRVVASLDWQEPDSIIEQYIEASAKPPKLLSPRLSPGKSWQNRRSPRKQIADNCRGGIISVNDASETEVGLTRGENMHALITKGFRYAREFALRHEHRLGFTQHIEPNDPPALES